MEKERRCLIAVDLDNTILKEYFSLDSESVRALIQAKLAGHIVMIASARPSCMALPYYHLLKPQSCLSLLNGSYLYHPDQPNSPVYSHLIDADTVERLIQAVTALDVCAVWLEIDDDIYTTPVPRIEQPYFAEVFRQSRVHAVDAAADLPRIPTAQFNVIAESDAQRDAVLETFAAFDNIVIEHYPDPAGGHHINAFSRQANKWHAVQWAAEHYGILPENIYTFGDQINDRMMITSAAHGFAMCNGNESVKADALAAGKRVTDYPCGQGGVGKEICKWIL